MPLTREAGGVTWTRNPDGEHNEWIADVNGHKVVVYSDSNGDHWYYTVDDGEYADLESDVLWAVLAEAADEVRKL